MSELDPSLGNGAPTTDILRLFREDLGPKDRVETFQQAAQQIREQVEALATPDNIARINDSFDVHFVFNAHGDAVNAAQTVGAIDGPFITFVENAGDSEIEENQLFGDSVRNAFDMNFSRTAPTRPAFVPQSPFEWGYWRDRGLMAKGSIIAPVDIRHYSRRLLDALMGNDYDQGYLSRSIPGAELYTKPFETLLEEQSQKGLLVMHSNAVRELTSTKQILETLLGCLDTEAGRPAYSPDVADKLRALMQKQRLGQDRLPVYIVYGGAHHSFMHVFRNLGIYADRTFPGSVDVNGPFSMHGSVTDQFFSSHPFGISELQTEKYAKNHILESMLWEIIDNPIAYGLVVDTRATGAALWQKVMYIARRPELVEQVEDIYENFQNDPLVAWKILDKYGIRLTKIG